MQRHRREEIQRTARSQWNLRNGDLEQPISQLGSPSPSREDHLDPETL